MATVTLPYTEDFESGDWPDFATVGSSIFGISIGRGSVQSQWAAEGFRAGVIKHSLGSTTTSYRKIDWTGINTCFIEGYIRIDSLTVATGASTFILAGGNAVPLLQARESTANGSGHVAEIGVFRDFTGKLWLAHRFWNYSTSAWVGEAFGLRIDNKLGQWIRFKWEIRFNNNSTADDGAQFDRWQTDGTLTTHSKFNYNAGTQQKDIGGIWIGVHQPASGDAISYRLDDLRIAASSLNASVTASYVLPWKLDLPSGVPAPLAPSTAKDLQLQAEIHGVSLSSADAEADGTREIIDPSSIREASWEWSAKGGTGRSTLRLTRTPDTATSFRTPATITLRGRADFRDPLSSAGQGRSILRFQPFVFSRGLLREWRWEVARGSSLALESNQMADQIRGLVARREFRDKEVSQIVRKLWEQFGVLSNGILNSYVFIPFPTAVVLSSFRVDGSIGDALDELAEISGFIWGVSADRAFYFMPRGDYPTWSFRSFYRFAFPSAGEFGIAELSEEESFGIGDLLTRIIVRGGAATSSPIFGTVQATPQLGTGIGASSDPDVDAANNIFTTKSPGQALAWIGDPFQKDPDDFFTGWKIQFFSNPWKKASPGTTDILNDRQIRTITKSFRISEPSAYAGYTYFEVDTPLPMPISDGGVVTTGWFLLADTYALTPSSSGAIVVDQTSASAVAKWGVKREALQSVTSAVTESEARAAAQSILLEKSKPKGTVTLKLSKHNVVVEPATAYASELVPMGGGSGSGVFGTGWGSGLSGLPNQVVSIREPGISASVQRDLLGFSDAFRTASSAPVTASFGFDTWGSTACSILTGATALGTATTGSHARIDHTVATSETIIATDIGGPDDSTTGLAKKWGYESSSGEQFTSCFLKIGTGSFALSDGGILPLFKLEEIDVVTPIAPWSATVCVKNTAGTYHLYVRMTDGTTTENWDPGATFTLPLNSWFRLGIRTQRVSAGTAALGPFVLGSAKIFAAKATATPWTLNTEGDLSFTPSSAKLTSGRKVTLGGAILSGTYTTKDKLDVTDFSIGHRYPLIATGDEPTTIMGPQVDIDKWGIERVMILDRVRYQMSGQRLDRTVTLADPEPSIAASLSSLKARLHKEEVRT